MLEELTDKLESVFKRLKGQGKISEKNIADSMREVRRVLLEADVNYKVAKKFIAQVQERAVGQEVLKSITPGQQIVKIFHDELVKLLGSKPEEIKFSGKVPAIIMVAGLQGSGKTSLCGKLALYLRKKGRNPFLVAADIYRPAAQDQLVQIAKGLNVDFYAPQGIKPVQMAVDSVEQAQLKGYDTIILDTAGRLHIDEDMMAELSAIRDKVKPDEILFVADGMTGQDAVNTAKSFNDQLDFQGVVLTKLDGDTKGGAALSIRSVTEKPIKFIAVGEKPDALELFYPDRMASRILGMGDIVSLVEKAGEVVDLEKAEKLEMKLRKAEFTLEDFLDQIHQIKQMGPLDQIMGMIPGMRGMSLKGLSVDDKALVKTEAIISSMTKEERRRPNILNSSRKKRIASGSGTLIQDVNRLVKQFSQMQKMMKTMSRMKPGKMNMPMGGFNF